MSEEKKSLYDISWKVTEEEYRKSPALSYSTIARFHRDGFDGLDKLFDKYPTTELQASGLSVGLPEGQMGNSEVGHLNIGSGRIVYQELTRITKAISDRDFLTCYIAI